MDERTLATACLDHGVAFQQPIGLGDGVRIDLQLSCKLANGGQRRARLQLATFYCLTNLRDELQEDRLGQSFVDRDLHGSEIAFVLCVLVVHVVQQKGKTTRPANVFRELLLTRRSSKG